MPNPNVNDFLNPKSMLTPGLAGSMTMVITNALVTHFGASPPHTALIISALFGAIVFAAVRTALWLRGVLYILNSLLIFSIALGTNQLGVNVATASGPAAGAADAVDTPASAAEIRPVYFSNWLDGTTGQRQQLLASTAEIEDHQAAQVLRTLGATEVELKNPRAALLSRSAHVRTAEQAADIAIAFDRAGATAELRRRDDRVAGRERRRPTLHPRNWSNGRTQPGLLDQEKSTHPGREMVTPDLK